MQQLQLLTWINANVSDWSIKKWCEQWHWEREGEREDSSCIELSESTLTVQWIRRCTGMRDESETCHPQLHSHPPIETEICTMNKSIDSELKWTWNNSLISCVQVSVSECVCGMKMNHRSSGNSSAYSGTIDEKRDEIVCLLSLSLSLFNCHRQQRWHVHIECKMSSEASHNSICHRESDQMMWMETVSFSKYKMRLLSVWCQFVKSIW